MARRDELLISRSIILRPTRALAAGSLFACPGVSDLIGLADASVSPEPLDALLNIRGRELGIDSVVAALEST